MTLSALLRPARRSIESMKAYRERRQAGNAYVKRARRGRMLWPSRQGTYRIAEHGALK